MSAINDLLNQITDSKLKERIEEEINRTLRNKKFGLVFEEHLPECSLLHGVEIKKGSNVTYKEGQVKELYRILKIDGNEALCINKLTEEISKISLNSLVCVAEFGETIYPQLKPIDYVENSKGNDLWHTLIEADNYHALQLLEYLYPKKVDCIYIDPPYNSGAKDWKYNNDYVDESDLYRHSKWLSMMERRLRLAKKLLNPNDSVLIVSIDEKEYLHLGCLLEQIFPEANIQMISSVISRKGAARMNEFTRVNEFIFFVMIGKYSISLLDDAEYALEGEEVHWQSFRRSSAKNIRTSRPSQFYPIYVNKYTNRIEKVGDPITHDIDRFSVEQLPNCEAVFPVRDDGTEMLWGVTPEECRQRVEKGYLRAKKHTPGKPQLYVMQYLMSGTIDDIENGKITITSYAEDGSVIAKNLETKKIMPRTQWNKDSHDARDYGTKIVNSIIGESKFEFPKSLYAVYDCLKYFVNNKPNALIVDFFAGSGTTLHAVNLLNYQDNGNRRCIMVTNNEISEKEEKDFKDRGIFSGDQEWEERGIARYVTWPRTKYSILGIDSSGNRLDGDYGVEREDYILDEEDIIVSKSTGKPTTKKIFVKGKVQDYPELCTLKRGDGFKSNVEYFKLGFLDKDAVALGRQFKELLPILWMKAGAIGKRPELESETIPNIMIFPNNRFAILTSENHYIEFEAEIDLHPEIETVYIVTDSEAGYREIACRLKVKNIYQLYRDYLDNFRINRRR